MRQSKRRSATKVVGWDLCRQLHLLADSFEPRLLDGPLPHDVGLKENWQNTNPDAKNSATYYWLISSGAILT